MDRAHARPITTALRAEGWECLLTWPDGAVRHEILLDIWLHGRDGGLRGVTPDSETGSLFVRRAIEDAVEPLDHGPAWESYRREARLHVLGRRMADDVTQLRTWLSRCTREGSTTWAALASVGWDEIARKDPSQGWAMTLWAHAGGDSRCRDVWLQSVPPHLRGNVIAAAGGDLPLEYAWEVVRA